MYKTSNLLSFMNSITNVFVQLYDTELVQLSRVDLLIYLSGYHACVYECTHYITPVFMNVHITLCVCTISDNII